MAEGSELMNRLMSENADLKKQVRLMKENQMLKRLLSESCQESCGRGGRDFLFPKAPAYPEACSPGSTGELGLGGVWARGGPAWASGAPSMVVAEVRPQRLKTGPLRPAQGMVGPGCV